MGLKILLVNPAWGRGRAGARRYRRAWPPLDLLYAASMLREKGHHPILADLRAGGIPAGALPQMASRADLILFQTTPLDRWQCPDLDWRALGAMTAGLPKDRLVMAGGHGTVAPEAVLNLTRASALIRGEPETALGALAEAQGNPAGIDGLSYSRNGSMVHEPDRSRPDLNGFPQPAYDLISSDHYRYELLGPRLAVLETARGCPFSCGFCFKVMTGRTVRTRALDLVLGDIETVVGRWGAEAVYFIDLEFTLDRERTMVFCREIKKLGLRFRWCCQTRVDTVDPDLLAEMKAAGLTLIHFGLETFSPRLLETVGKPIDPARTARAMDWCRRLGLKTACFFLFGLPGETPRDRARTMAWARRLDPTYASFHVAAPYPKTALGDRAAGREPFPTATGLSRDRRILSRAVRKAMISFYLHPRYLKDRLRQGDLAGLIRQFGLWWDWVR